MRFQALLLLGLLVVALAYSPRKSNDGPRSVDKKTDENEIESQKIPLKKLDDIVKNVKFDEPEDDDDDNEEDLEDDEQEIQKKKPSAKKDKHKKIPKQDTEEIKKKKSDKTEEVSPVLDSPKLTHNAKEFLESVARAQELDRLRKIVSGVEYDNFYRFEQPVKEDEEEGDGTFEFQGCNFETAGDGELCHCDMDEINCSGIVMDSSDPYLHTADVRIVQKDFKPLIANFSENAISKLQNGKVLPGFEKYVVRFDIAYNQIRYIDSDVFKPFTNLSRLDLSHNNLQAIKKPVFDAVKNTLIHLDLSHNRIKTLTDNVFENLSQLKWLSLDGNKIKPWKKEYFKGLDNLEELSLDYCNIDDLPGDIFEYLPKLSVLSLRGNPMEEIPAVVAKTKTLKNVDMSLTNLTEIRDHAFAGDSDLVGILLQEMPFLSVIRDCAFCGLPKLKTLLLNDNSKLVEIHPNAFGFIKSDPGHKAADIIEFDIHNSNITTISENLLNYDKLETFKIAQNPWTCDCSTMFLMEDKFAFKSDSVQPICKYPAELKDRHLVTLHASEACEDARFLGRTGRFSSVLGLVLLVGFLAIGFFYLYTSGLLNKLVKKVRKEPEVSYSNLQNSGEDFALEADFQPRPAEV